MKIVAISDTHSKHSDIEIPECDVLIHAGDISSHGSLTEVVNFINWFSSQDKAKHKIFIAGNHDYALQKGSIPIPGNVTYLQDNFTIIDGVKFWGTPWTPFFYDWAFNGFDFPVGEKNDYHGGPGKSATPDPEHPPLSYKHGLIHNDTDVLICHGPPFNCLDCDDRDSRVGSHTLRSVIEEKKPKIAIFGHIHESIGQDCLFDTKCYNVSSLDQFYFVREDPTTIIEFS